MRSGNRWVGMLVAAVVALTACAGGSSGGTGDGSPDPASTDASAAGTDEPDRLPETTDPTEPANPTESAEPVEPADSDPDAVPATDAAADPAADPASGAKPWTILVYSIADTDLEPYMIDDVNEMGEVGTGDSLNLVALIDRASDYGDDPALDLGAWEGAKLVEIGPGTGTILEEMGDVNTGDPQVLTDFIARGIAEYPAEQYGLIISDHGAAWPGVGGDESSDHDTLTLTEIHDGIAAGLDAAGVERLTMLGFDACLMATYEVANRLAPLADRLIASQELEPGHGWDYRSLAAIDADPTIDVDTLGAGILDGFKAQAEAEDTAGNITLSLVDLTQMDALDAAVADLSQVIGDRAAAIAVTLGRVREDTLSFGRSPDSTEDTHMVDLGDLVGRIGVEALDVSNEADAVIRAIGDVVLTNVEGPAAIKSTGLSVYFPPNDGLFDAGYADVVGDSPWLGLLDAFYRQGGAIPADEQPEFLALDDARGSTATATFGPEGLTIRGVVDADSAPNITRSLISYGVIGDDGSITFLGQEAATFADDSTGEVSGTYDLTAFTLSDGEDTFTAYLDLDIDTEAAVATINIPMAYYAPDDVGGETYQDVMLAVTLDPETFEIIEETYYAYNETLGTYGELTAEPTGIIVPEVFVLSADGVGSWEPTSEIGLFADLPSLVYDVSPLPSGTRLYIDLSVTDFGGNSALAATEVTLP